MNPSRRSALALFSIAVLFGRGEMLRGADAPPATAPAPGEKLAVDGLALLRSWVPPVYPRAELKAKHSGMVTVRLIVDATGKVATARALEDSDEAFIEAALAAVRAWGFAPALDEGRPVACCLDTLVAFSPAVGQLEPSTTIPTDQSFTPAPKTSPRVKVSSGGDYPTVLTERKLPGRVHFACTVTTEGRGVNARAIGASHVDFVLPAIEGLEKWEFAPAMQGDLPVAGPVEGEVTFDSFWSKTNETLEANGIAGQDGPLPEAAPMVIFWADPVAPREALEKGEGGSATVEFRVNERGFVRDVRVIEASAPEFGEALRAAAETWVFEKPYADGKIQEVILVKKEEFAAVPTDGVTEEDGLARVVQKLRKGEIGGAKGLDEKLTPLYRVAPEYPRSLRGATAPKGAAEIELVIDRTGRVRAPRIVSASQPEFGWAAATAASQWVFKAPRRGGVPVDVKVTLPVAFAVPLD